MSVEHRNVVGYGIRLTPAMRQRAAEHLELNVNDFDPEDVFTDGVLVCEQYGDCWSGEGLGYLVSVAGPGPSEWLENTPEFLSQLAKKGLVIRKEDLSLVVEALIT